MSKLHTHNNKKLKLESSSNSTATKEPTSHTNNKKASEESFDYKQYNREMYEHEEIARKIFIDFEKESSLIASTGEMDTKLKMSKSHAELLSKIIKRHYNPTA